jgi:hypothetical protein
MIDLTKEDDVKALKECLEYSFKGPLGEKTLKFLEQFCGFYLGGPRADLNQLQYEAGRRDVILTIKTITHPDWTPGQVAEYYKRSNNASS